jgi:hypothetical protein
MKNLYNLRQIKSKKIILPTSIFFFFFFIFISSSGGHSDPVDGFVYFLMAENMVVKGSPTLNVNSTTALDFGFDVEKKIAGRTSGMAALEYDKNPDPNLTRSEHNKIAIENANREEFVGPYYILLPIIAAPLYVMAQFLGVYPFTFVPFFLNSIIITFICVVVFFFGKAVFGSEKIGFVLALIFGVTSFIWPYNSTMFARPLAILFLVLSMYFIYNNKNNQNIISPFLSAIFIGLSVLSHTFFVLYTIPLFGYGLISFKGNKKKLVTFLLGIVVISLVLGTVNHVRFDSVTDFGFGSIQEGSFLKASGEGLYAYLISPSLSIFLYFPIALLFPFSIYQLYKKEKSFTILLISIFAITYFYLSFGINWNMSMEWGPHRYFLAIIPLIVISLGSLMVDPSTKMRRLIISLSVIGFIFNMTASLVWSRFTMAASRGLAGELGGLDDYLNFRVWEPLLSPVLINFGILWLDYTARISSDPNRVSYVWKMVVPGCSFDVFIYCKFGIIPIILLGILIAILGFIILYFLGIIGNKKSVKIK